MDENTIEYWKEKYEELNAQYDDFQKSSHEFERELELQLEQAEDKMRKLENENLRFKVDNENMKTKLNELNTSTHKQISQLQEELAKFRAVKDEMQKYIRELEQKNDNLEQTNRCAMFSLGEFESKLNEALERNSILEMELDDKDELAETVQRLRDEARDLKQEIAVRQQKAQKELHNQSCQINDTLIISNANNQMDTDCVPSSSSSTQLLQQQQQTTNNSSLNNILNELLISQTKNTSSQQSTNATISNNHFQQQQQQQQQPVTPSIRISALNFVGDALRKVTVSVFFVVSTKSSTFC